MQKTYKKQISTHINAGKKAGIDIIATIKNSKK